jgi:hypothetical protein
MEENTIYDESVITSSDFANKINGIMDNITKCSIKDLKAIYVQFAKLKNANPDMNRFEPMNNSYIELFKRQIREGLAIADYDTLTEFEKYVISIIKH